jgi:ferritin-like metal-binding protein YciE
MTDPKEHLLDWLRDAHAMEEQAEQMLRAQASRLEHYPALRARIEQHLEETLGQKELVAGCLDRLGSKPSTLKDLAAKATAMGQGFGGMLMTDEVVKGGMMSYVFENFEIATYTTLIAAAQAAADPETKRVCELILRQEQAMAKWLIEQMPDVVGRFLVRDAADMTARR